MVRKAFMTAIIVFISDTDARLGVAFLASFFALLLVFNYRPFVDPKLDVAVQESEAGEKVQEIEYDIQKVTPRKIVLGDNWWQEVKEDGSYSDWYRDEISIDRSTGELAFKRFSLSKSATNYPDLAAGWKGKEHELPFGYDCQKPTRK